MAKSWVAIQLSPKKGMDEPKQLVSLEYAEMQVQILFCKTQLSFVSLDSHVAFLILGKHELDNAVALQRNTYLKVFSMQVKTQNYASFFVCTLYFFVLQWLSLFTTNTFRQ